MVLESKSMEKLEQMIGAAVSHYWDTRLSQQQKQQKSGKVDYGLRGAVTGGAKVFPEFKGASYMKRYEIFCRKLMLERHFTASAFIASDRESGPQGIFSTPAEELSVERFAKTLMAHIGGFIS